MANDDIFIKGQEETEETKTALLNILEDTEQARQREEEERKKTELLIANLADGLIVFDDARRADLVNPSAEKILALRAEDLLGKNIGELKSFITFRPLVGAVGEDLKEVVREEANIEEGRTVEVTTILLKQRGKGNETMMILHDITREKEIERLKTEFVSLAAHQLRTPLSAVKWTLHMFLDGDLGKLSAQQRDILEKTRRSNERMIDLVNDLLNVTRIEEGRYVYKHDLVPFAEFLEDVVKYYKEEAARRNIDFHVDYAKKKDANVWMDREKMALAFQSILDNALHYTLEGGKVKVAVTYGARKAAVSIQDTGIGILEEEKERVFEKFFRGSNAKKITTDGTGLGLYIAKNIISAHKGSIVIDSKPDEGTTVLVSLPVT